MRGITIIALTVVLVLALASPALAVTGSGGSGTDFGQHHATHAQDMGGFTSDMNPGTHQGFAGWGGV